MLWPIKAPQAPGGSGNPGTPEDAAAVIRELRGTAPENLDTFEEVASKISEIEHRDPGDLTSILRDQMR